MLLIPCQQAGRYYLGLAHKSYASSEAEASQLGKLEEESRPLVDK